MTLSLLPGSVQVRLSRPKAPFDKDTVQSWSVPAWILPVVSPSVQQGLGEHTPHPTILHARLAQAMGIQEGDFISIEFVDIGECFHLPVSVKATVPTALLVHGALSMGLIKSLDPDDNEGETLVFHSGKTLKTANQSFWAGLRVEPPRTARAILEFHGATNGNGYGYCVRLSDKFGQLDKSDNSLLLQGYGYAPSSDLSKDQMEYTGLLEGLWWAMRLHVQTLWVRGDAEIIINQVHGTYPCKDEMLKEYHDQVLMGLEQAEKRGITCIVEHIPKEANTLAMSLATFGNELKQCTTVVKWVNCNKL